MPDWLLTISGVAAGGALTLMSGWLNDFRLSRREREKREEERKDKAALRRIEFQRETLLALQLASQALMRNNGKALHHDIVAHRSEGKKWQRQQLPEGLSDDLLRQNTEVMLLSSRIRSEEIRQLATTLREALGSVGNAPSERDANAMMERAAVIHHTMIESIGRTIREIDEAA